MIKCNNNGNIHLHFEQLCTVTRELVEQAILGGTASMACSTTQGGDILDVPFGNHLMIIVLNDVIYTGICNS